MFPQYQIHSDIAPHPSLRAFLEAENDQPSACLHQTSDQDGSMEHWFLMFKLLKQ